MRSITLSITKIAVSCFLIGSSFASVAFAKENNGKLISSAATQNGKTRTVVFPKRGVGTYYLDIPDYDFLDPLAHLPVGKPAKGSVTVPQGAKITLEPGYGVQTDLRELKTIRPEDIYAFSLEGSLVSKDIARNASSLNKLTSLDVAGTAIEDAWLDVLLKANPQLKELISSTAPKLTDKALDSIVSMHALQKLDIGHTRFTEAGLHKVAAMKNLQWLDLAGTNADDRTLAVLAKMPALTTLNLSETRVTDKGLAALKECHSLKNLGLEHTAITDAGLKDAISKMPQLEELNLSATKVTDAGIGYLDGNANLRKLWLRETVVTPAITPALQRHAKLEQLEVQKTKWNSLATHKIGELMPKLHAHAQKLCSCKKYQRTN